MVVDAVVVVVPLMPCTTSSPEALVRYSNRASLVPFEVSLEKITPDAERLLKFPNTMLWTLS